VRRLLPSVVAIAALIAATTAFAARNGEASARLVKVKTTVARGDQAHLVANVVPARLCTIAVSKRGTRMKPKRVDRWGLGLYPKRSTAGGDYRLAWTWTVGPHTALGPWRIRVDCGSAGSFQTTFTVVR
jgi:hypothetical protein